MNHAELYTSLVRAIRFADLMKAHHVPLLDQQICYSAVDAVLPFDVHRSMFAPTLENQTSPEQREKWLPLAVKLNIIGAYAQTELGEPSPAAALPSQPD